MWYSHEPDGGVYSHFVNFLLYDIHWFDIRVDIERDEQILQHAEIRR
jgi:hypothetical protein